MTTATSAAVPLGGSASFSALHSDVFQSHILARLDGPSLASLTCVSSQLHALSTEDHLWRNLCSSTWPSVNHPRVQQTVSTFPSGHRSFFSDSYPFPDPRPLKLDVDSSALPTELIFAVDVYYQNEIIYSKVEEIDTSSSWFLSSLFRVDVLDPKDSASSPVKCIGGGDGDETWVKHMEENLRLSWIVIDPVQKRAVNMSSRRAVSVQRHWLTGDVQVRFGTVVAGGERRGCAREWVECGVVVTCCGKEGGEMQMREVSMVMEDIEGKGLNGRESLVILGRVTGDGRRKEGKEKYDDFQQRKKQRKEENQRQEKLLDLACITIGVAGFLTFWSVVLFK
ncbi:hypothetical protein V6N13_082508 [Hibiscus sabdariffa]|uniref:F-box domain-containing protein n=1 Tax=Hibiscus sabdariffa TaxID=183260 RepID=A0ABR2Q4B2_9ROSI